MNWRARRPRPTWAAFAWVGVCCTVSGACGRLGYERLELNTPDVGSPATGDSGGARDPDDAAAEVPDAGPSATLDSSVPELPEAGPGAMLDSGLSKTQDASPSTTPDSSLAGMPDGAVPTDPTEAAPDSSADGDSSSADTSTSPSCVDGQRNGDESDIDCGGSGCNRCGRGQLCSSVSDCSTSNCSLAGFCDGWAFRKEIVVDPARVMTELTDYPLLVRIRSDAQLATGTALPTGGDIYFTASDGSTRLDHEIESFDKSSGDLVAWVRLPALASSVPTRIYINYGNPDAGDQQMPSGVWDARYTSVWHMSQDPGPAGVGDIIDSTGSSPATAHGSMDASDSVAGQIGLGIDFDGLDDELTFTNTFVGTGAHTISAWVNQRPTDGIDTVIAFGEEGTSSARWMASNFGLQQTISGGFHGDYRYTGSDVRGAGWSLIVWTYDGAESALYLNGIWQESGAHSGADTVGGDGWIGSGFVPTESGSFGPAEYFDGQLDEIRIFAGVRSTDWIQTEFNNQSAPESFALVSAQQPFAP